MRDPLRRQVKSIGAKLLRNGVEGNSSNSMQGDQDKQIGEDEGNQDPNFTSKNKDAIGQGG